MAKFNVVTSGRTGAGPSGEFDDVVDIPVADLGVAADTQRAFDANEAVETMTSESQSDLYTPQTGITPEGNIQPLSERADTLAQRELNVAPPVTPSQVKTGNPWEDNLSAMKNRADTIGAKMNAVGATEVRDGQLVNIPAEHTLPIFPPKPYEPYVFAALEKELAVPNDGTPESQEMFDAARAETNAILSNMGKENTLPQALHALGAVEYNPEIRRTRIHPDFGTTGGLVAEHVLDKAFMGTQDTITPEDAQVDFEEGEIEPVKTVNPSAVARQLGREIEKWWGAEAKGATGVAPLRPLSERESTDLGAMMVQMYQAANPDMVRVATLEEKKDAGDPTDTGSRYILTPTAQTEFENTRAERDQLFGIKTQPLTARPTVVELEGDMKSVSPAFKGKGTMGDVAKISESMLNQSRVTHMVDNRRAAIAMLTMMPALMGGAQGSQAGDIFSDAHGVGKQSFNKVAFHFEKIEGPEKGLVGERAKTEGIAKAKRVEASKKRKAFNELSAIFENRDKLLWFSFAAQPLTARSSATQTILNPTTSKLARFVTRSPQVVTVRKGSEEQDSLIQMYATILSPGDQDLLLPTNRRDAMRELYQREVKKVKDLKAGEPKFQKWGEGLKAAIAEASDPVLLNQISDAQKQGIPIRDQRHPLANPANHQKMAGLEGYINSDPELMAYLKKKKEDLPLAIDTLIDFADHTNAMKAGRPHMTTLNAYVDGKTNGIASQGMQIGSREIALNVGALRPDSSRYVLDETDGEPTDIRVAMKKGILNQLREDGTVPFGISGTWNNEQKVTFDKVIAALASYKGLNKAISMIFPYGKELASMKKEVQDNITTLMSEDPEFASYVNALEGTPFTMEVITNTAHANVTGALTRIFGEDTFKARGLMRTSALLHAAMDKIFQIKSPVGHTINLGGMKNVLEQAEESQVSVGTRTFDEKGKSTVKTASPLTLQTSPKVMSSAATRMKGGVAAIGGYAYGRAAVVPTQAIDAATVIKTTTGPSWERIKQEVGGDDPYLYQIYDAFKTDVKGFKSIVREVNQNWLDTSLKDWNYFEESNQAMKKALSAFRGEIDEYIKTDPNREFSLASGKFDFIGALINPYVERSEATGEMIGNPQYRQLMSFVKSYMHPNLGASEEFQKKLLKNEADSFLRSVGTIVGGEYSPSLTSANNIKTLTASQIKAIVELMVSRSRIMETLPAFVEKVDYNKKVLYSEIMDMQRRTGVGSMQYYGH